MVTSASRANEWDRASYLDLEGAPRAPQSIGALLPQVLARYALPVHPPDDAEATAKSLEGQRATRLATQRA